MKKMDQQKSSKAHKFSWRQNSGASMMTEHGDLQRLLLEMELRAFYVLGKCFTSEPHPHSLVLLADLKFRSHYV